jgi:hypothetical protein
MRATTCIISPLNSSKNKEEMPAYTYLERRLHNINLYIFHKYREISVLTMKKKQQG